MSKVFQQIKSFFVLQKHRYVMFFTFILLSFVIWIFIKLDKVYQTSVTFEVIHTNLPKGFAIGKQPIRIIKVRIEDNGSKIFRYKYLKSKLKIDLSTLNHRKEGHYLPIRYYNKFIKENLQSSAEIIEIDPDTLFIDLDTLFGKTVPITPDIKFTFQEGFYLSERVTCTPDSIFLRGFKRMLSGVEEVRTRPFVRGEINKSFEDSLVLDFPKGFSKAYQDFSSVKVRVFVSRMYEEVFEVPIKVTNVPEGASARVFPKEVRLLCKGSLDIIKSLEVSDFDVVFDYSKYVNDSIKNIEIVKMPNNVETKPLLEEEFEVLIKE